MSKSFRLAGSVLGIVALSAGITAVASSATASASTLSVKSAPAAIIRPRALAPPAARRAVRSPAGPSGIGLPEGGPEILANSLYYDRALKSSDWGRTPDGLVYKSCVYQIPMGAKLDAERNEIIEPSGAKRTTPKCPYPRLLPPGAARQPHARAAIRPDAVVDPLNQQWLISAWSSSGSSWFTSLSVDYAVPTAPSVAGATDYLFSSFTEGDGATILQPVVGYGPTEGPNGNIFGGNYLWMASYYVWSGGVALGPLRKVNALDTITGTMNGTSCGSGGGNCTWTIVTKDANTGQSSEAIVGSSPAFVDLQGGVLESTGGGCDKLFANEHGVFRNISASTPNGKVTPSWTVFTAGQCSMTETGTATSLDILWKG
jgi:hypothetical protein